MSKIGVLVVEDDPALNDMLRFMLEQQGYHVHSAMDTASAEHHLAAQLPDIIILDWMLPKVSGVEFARQLKGNLRTTDVPILMLTARGEESDLINGLDAGADDYMVKPFSQKELLARIRAVLRRSKPQKLGCVIAHQSIQINPESRTLSINELPVEIGNKEFDLLYLFMHKPDRVYTREQLLDQIWGHDSFLDDRTVDVYIRRVRKVLENHGYADLIKTVRGIGYRLGN